MIIQGTISDIYVRKEYRGSEVIYNLLMKLIHKLSECNVKSTIMVV